MPHKDYPPTVIEVLRTPLGRWRWWKGMQQLDYVKKGERTPQCVVHLDEPRNNLDGAIRKACLVEAEVRLLKVRREQRQAEKEVALG